jgi:oligopeptide transport system permease protein
VGERKVPKFIVRRIILSLITAWMVVTFTFLLMHHLPGDPFVSKKVVPPEIMENITAKYGLDKPIYEQYIIYIGNVLKGDLGISMKYANKSVNSIIARAFPVSFDLGLRALFIAIFTGILLGLIAALNKNKPFDDIALFISVIGVSIPGFVLGTLAQYLLCYKFSGFVSNVTGSSFRLFPVSGWNGFRYTVVPSIVLAFSAMAFILRMMRSSLLEVLNQNYIVGARVKGLTKREIVLKHGLKNALFPIISILGPLTASILLGSFAIEKIFSIPGLGHYLVSSVQDKDYTMVIGLSLFTSLIVVLVNTITDILYSIMDPRVKL